MNILVNILEHFASNFIDKVGNTTVLTWLALAINEFRPVYTTLTFGPVLQLDDHVWIDDGCQSLSVSVEGCAVTDVEG